MSRPTARRALLVTGTSLLTLSALSLSLHLGCGGGSDPNADLQLTPTQRFVEAVDEVAAEEEPAPDALVRYRAEEKKEAKPTSQDKGGLYAIQGPKDAVPQLARTFDPQAPPATRAAGKRRSKKMKRLPGHAGGRGSGVPHEMTQAEADALGMPHGGAFAIGNDDQDVWGGAPGRRPVGEAEAYDRIEDNPLTAVLDDPRSTFSIDVDTASYANVRRLLNQGSMPPPGAVRVEEMVNYFDYDYAPPDGDVPFSMTAEVGPCPWNPERQLVHIGLQGKVIERDDVPPRNLVFLLDVSGSMDDPNKLPLVKRALGFLTEGLDDDDRVSIVVYAGASGLVLPPTSGADKRAILGALERLDAGGSTNGGEGIELAYRVAEENFIADGVNRVILATDGDFNVGTTSRSELVRLIERKREGGTFLSVLGFGMGNLKDATMEQLADKGNGNYAYIDTAMEARKVLVDEAGATLVTIAKDVKIQTEFNPARVSSYRLVGYENRILAHQDFNDDKKDAGEIGAGHTVTALYEIVPATGAAADPKVDPLKYQTERLPAMAAASDELMTVKIRYKEPDGDTSTKLELPIAGDALALDATSDDFRFSAAVAELGMLLRGRELADASYAEVLELAAGARGPDAHCYRAEMLTLVGKAALLAGEPIDAPTTVDCTPRAPKPAAERITVTDPKTGDGPTFQPAATLWSVVGHLLAFVRGLPTIIQLVPGLLALPLLLLAFRRGRRG